jgi:16S rRNA (cytosine1402-N4)-methyltransferase
MLDEVILALRAKAGETIVDATLGGGGYARAIMAASGCGLLAVDRDPAALARASAWAAEWPGLTLRQGRFSELRDILDELGIAAVDGIVADLGMSSDQLDDAGRGFSFREDGPLDMRMDQDGRSAADLVAELAEAELTALFRNLGDEPDARRIARAIANDRVQAPFLTTEALRGLVGRVTGGKRGHHDPATRVFQALRMAVNDELGELGRLMAIAPLCLKPGGRLVIVTFHSGEDRLVKRAIDAETGHGVTRSRHAPPIVSQRAPRMVWASGRQAIAAGAEEIARNPRARSAKLRAALRTEAPADDSDDGPDWRRAA